MGHYLVKARQIKLCVKSRPRFRYNRISPVSVNKMNCLLRHILIAVTMGPASHHARLQENLGGGSSLTYSLAQINEHLVVRSHGLDQVLKDAVFRYVAHVDDVELLKYPFPAYIHCKMLLETLLPMLPVTHARKIAALHGLSPGSRCTQKHLLTCIENHSCLRCRSHFTVFSVDEGAKKLCSKHAAKHKASKASPEYN